MASLGWQSGDVPHRIGILTAGGPAPGLNGVINAVTVSARARGWTVIGLPQGYKHLMAGPEAAAKAARELREQDVAGIESQGGSILRMSRSNPGKKEEDLERTVAAVRALGLTALVTVGGDDTASAAAKVADRVGAGFRVAHVPKTIDNDLPLPGEAPTFGYETAKDVGAQLCRNLREDARTTGRWVLVTAMGRSAGHLAVGMAIGSGADVCVIPEEFPAGPIRLQQVADLVERAVVRRRAEGQDWGLAVLAEGILDRLEPSELKAVVPGLEFDDHGNPRLSEVDLGKVVRDLVAPRLAEAKAETGFITKLLGYELRCAPPTAFDIQYTRTLGAGAVEFLATGSGNAIVTVRDGRILPLRFEELRDPQTGRVRVRRVDPQGAAWQACLALQARDATVSATVTA
ncbi:MAG TPA: 6-phosphofructokinase [Candidatus Thermoplasmatota archaeon]|nr:6-phosphofructokinase [Candidatus Thermoplasmatota archaeon]